MTVTGPVAGGGQSTPCLLPAPITCLSGAPFSPRPESWSSCSCVGGWPWPWQPHQRPHVGGCPLPTGLIAWTSPWARGTWRAGGRVGMNASGEQARHPYSPLHTHTVRASHAPQTRVIPGTVAPPSPPTDIHNTCSILHLGHLALPPAARCKSLHLRAANQGRGETPGGFKTRPLRPVEFSTGTGHTLSVRAAFPGRAALPSATYKLLFPRGRPVATQPLGAATHCPSWWTPGCLRSP